MLRMVPHTNRGQVRFDSNYKSGFFGGAISINQTRYGKKIVFFDFQSDAFSFICYGIAVTRRSTEAGS